MKNKFNLRPQKHKIKLKKSNNNLNQREGKIKQARMQIIQSKVK